MGVIEEKFDEKSCGIVLFRDEGGERQYLLLHYPGGHWDFPKGHVEDYDKDEHATAHRELLEETGIADIEFVDGFRERVSYEYYVKGGEKSNKQVIFFIAKTELKEVKISHEHHAHIWLPYNAAFNKITFDNARNLLTKVKEFLTV